MDRLDGRAAFSVGRRLYRWPDVLLAAEKWGAMKPLRSRASQGVASLKRIRPDEAAIDEAADAWRYAHDLLSADDMQSWLDGRRLDMEEWTGYIERSVAREQTAGQKQELSRKEVDAVLYADVVCSGALGELAERLAGRAAIYDREKGSGKDKTPNERHVSMTFLSTLDTTFDGFVRELASPAALSREIEGRELEWTRLDCDTVAFAADDAAKEAALLIREDELPLGKAATMAKASVKRSRYLLEDVDSPLKDSLVGALPGQLVGPVTANGGSLLLMVVDRIAPSTKDSELRKRARDRLVSRTVRAEIAKRVKWHDGL